MEIRITCINKDNGNHDNPYEAITHLGWINPENNKTGKSTRLVIYDWIKDENGYAYVQDASGKKVKVITAISPKGTKYVKTEANHTEQDNLLSLKECV
jgi:hypothetical protein